MRNSSLASVRDAGRHDHEIYMVADASGGTSKAGPNDDGDAAHDPVGAIPATRAAGDAGGGSATGREETSTRCGDGQTVREHSWRATAWAWDYALPPAVRKAVVPPEERALATLAPGPGLR